MQPRVKLRSLFWTKSPRQRDTVWDVVGRGDLPMHAGHLTALEQLFLQSASSSALRSSGGSGAPPPPSPLPPLSARPKLGRIITLPQPQLAV